MLPIDIPAPSNAGDGWAILVITGQGPGAASYIFIKQRDDHILVHRSQLRALRAAIDAAMTSAD